MSEKLTQYPEGLDTLVELPNIDAEDREDGEGVEHDVVHTAANQAIRALQAKVGKDNDPNENSIDFRLKKIEEQGGGGSGLAVGDEDPPMAGGNENIVIPDHPSAWLEAVIDGVSYVVPGYRVGELVPLEDFYGETAALFRPVLFRAHTYRPVEE